MAENSNSTIYPCPFSKGYGIPAQQAWLLLKIYLIYRFILACLFMLLFFGRMGPSMIETHDKPLLMYSSLSYFALTIISAILIFRKLTGYTVQAQQLIFTDIVIVTLIMHACGGINSGIGMLLAVSIAAGGLLIGGRCAMLFAALASLAILAEQIYFTQTHSFVASAYTYSGMLGAAFFTIALLSMVLAQRTEQTVQLANRRQQTIIQLEELNRYIIQHLQSGILITNENQLIQMSNNTALKLLKMADLPKTMQEISGNLAYAFTIWRNDPRQNFSLVQLPDASEIQVRFTELPTQAEVFHMTILEDVALYNQRLQQSKLASLGRLTASIAHEIRNPLGAISHAGQLLSENPDLSDEDKRLTEIMHVHCLRVNRIIEDILQLSRRHNSIRSNINLKSWLLEFLENFIIENDIRPDIFRTNFQTEQVNVFIDPGHLQQIMDNLCRNAVKYGRPNQEFILLQLRMIDSIPCLEIIDQGPGVSKANQNHLFEPFFTTSVDGTGLGLYISRELAELNQAKLSYYCSETEPSCFRLCLPNAEQTSIEI